jgi:metal-dependent amidase/aminoacylase/carboxypeptidase family protein
MSNRPLGLSFVVLIFFFATSVVEAEEPLNEVIQSDYDSHLWPLFDYFHRNPELSLVETKTAARLAKELRDAGFQVREGVGGTESSHSWRMGRAPW